MDDPNRTNQDAHNDENTRPIGGGVSPQLTGREFWRSVDELAGTDEFKSFSEREFQDEAQVLDGDDRRHFLKIMGAGFALAGLGAAACRRLPESKIAPFAHRPVDRIPGMPIDFATSFELGGVGDGVLARSYDGRPVNISGNASRPDNPTGAASAMAIGSVLSLYDPDRLRVLTHNGTASDWDSFVAWLGERTAADAGGSGLAVLSRAHGGPSAKRFAAKFASQFPEATDAEWEAIDDANARAGTALAFGAPHRAQPNFADAEIVVSLDADFLGNEPCAEASSGQWASRRRLAGDPSHATMSRVYQFEAMLTVTGMASDERIAVRAGELPLVAAVLLNRIAGTSFDTSAFESALGGSVNRVFEDAHGKTVELSALDLLEKAAADLAAHKGSCLVVAGSGQGAAVHAAAALLNDALGNVGKTIDYTTLEAKQSSVEQLRALVGKMNAGTVKTLVLFDVNPIYDAPADIDFAAAIAKVDAVVYVGTHSNATSASSASTWIVPGAHALEAWGDTRAWDGTIGVVQPLIEPLVDRSQGGRSQLEILAILCGDNEPDGLSIVRDTAREMGGAQATGVYSFEKAWRKILANGFVAGTQTSRTTPAANNAATTGALSAAVSDAPGASDLELVLTHDTKVYDGRFANNGWMQELPEAVTKLTWDNALLMGPGLADAHGVRTGDMVRVSTGDAMIETAVMVIPGYAPLSCSLTLGYGQGESAGRIANDAGFDAYPLRRSDAMDRVATVTIENLSKRYELAHTQDHGVYGALDEKVVRDGVQERLPSIIREGSLEMYREDPGFAGDLAHVAHSLSLWEETNLDGANHRWAMSIDLSTCTGCSACVTACQAENNIPVVGKDQVIRGREMHWIRIDRYFKGGTVSTPEQVVSQPVMCQHCENAACEQVCPVAATVHDKDGLNVMVYNRCIGTRYCSNNCPYKVRRFNWFDYQRREPVREQEGFFAVKPDYYTSDGPNEWQRMAYNPEVTVRTRGVMEKCSFCVQRISAAKIKYKNEWAQAGGGANGSHFSIPDGAITTACQDACATSAIIFGDLNNPKSAVSKLHKSKRTYDLLGELNPKTRVKYMARISNPAAERAVFKKPHGEHDSHDGHDDHDNHDDHAGLQGTTGVKA